MDNIDLSDLFTTKAEATDFMSRLSAISSTLFQTNFNLDKALTEHFGINKKDRFIAIMRESNINRESFPAVKDFLFLLMTKINSLPVLSLTVAFEPHEETLKGVSEWFFINMKKQVLFDISINRRLVAGAAITYNGKFYDFSIKPVFDRILKNYPTRLAASYTHAAAQANPAASPSVPA